MTLRTATSRQPCSRSPVYLPLTVKYAEAGCAISAPACRRNRGKPGFEVRLATAGTVNKGQESVFSYCLATAGGLGQRMIRREKAIRCHLAFLDRTRDCSRERDAFTAGERCKIHRLW